MKCASLFAVVGLASLVQVLLVGAQQPAATAQAPARKGTLQLGNFSVSLTVKDLAKSRAFYEALLARTRRGGVLVLDNMLQSGRVLAPRDPASRAIHALNERIARDERVENVLLAVRDGVQLVVKR